MTPRENLLRLFRREGWEWAPWEFQLCPSLVEEYVRREKSELPYEEYFGFPWRHLSKPLQADRDLERFNPWHREKDLRDPAVVIDDWGIGHRSTPTSMHMTEMLHPLEGASTLSDLESYPFPQYRPEDNAHLAQEAAAIQKRGLAVMGILNVTVWETAWYLRGMENLMMDMMDDEDMAACLLDRVEAASVQRARIYAKAGVDILHLGDDIGMQRSIMMSEALYARWLKPALARVIGAAKAIKPDILIHYHSCGYVKPFIPHLIEVGVDILNPVQPECMDFEEIHAMYGDRLSFHGTIGTQTTMPFGSPQEVKDTVKRNLRIAGERGGLLAAPTHLLEPEVPWDNVLAYVEACRETKSQAR